MAGAIGFTLYEVSVAPESELILVKDYSGSSAQASKHQDAEVVLALDNAPPHTHLDLFRMGATTEEIFSGSLDDASTESITKTLKQETDLADDRKGTNFAKMAEAVSKAAASSRAKVVRVEIFTDGGDDFLDPGSVARYRKAASAICKDQRLAPVIFSGVRPEYREAIRTAWKDAGNKLQILTADQLGD